MSREVFRALYRRRVEMGEIKPSGRKPKSLLNKRSQVVIGVSNQKLYDLAKEKHPDLDMSVEEAIKVGKKIFQEINKIDEE